MRHRWITEDGFTLTVTLIGAQVDSDRNPNWGTELTPIVTLNLKQMPVLYTRTVRVRVRVSVSVRVSVRVRPQTDASPFHAHIATPFAPPV